MSCAISTLLLNAVIRIGTTLKPDKDLPIRLLLPTTDLRFPICPRHIIHSINQVATYTIL